jgi:alkylation response protein AidB-like acyl-CoA dehydrogenase
MSERYLPGPDQTALARSLGESLRSVLAPSRPQTTQEESVQTWALLRELGVLGISTPEEQGGGGLGPVEEALVTVELGRRVVGPSVLATMGAAHLRSGNPQHLAGDGGARIAAGFRVGDRVLLVDAPGVGEVLVRDQVGARLHSVPDSTRVIDEQLWSVRLLEAIGLGEPLAIASPTQALRLRLIDAAALAGLARAAADMAVEYAAMREQFGRPIGSFQAVKHHCANMALAARCACDQVSFAATAVADGRDDARLQVESAFFVAGTAALDNGGRNIQVHGGIGFSDEAVPHRLLKRARVWVQIAGGLEAALGRIERCSPALRLPRTEPTAPCGGGVGA